MVVIDTSALLALLFGESTADWVAEQLNDHSAALVMSTINLTEALIRVRDLYPADAARIESELFTRGIRFVSPDVRQAKLAAEARLKFPINLGDCFAYALAVAEDCPVLTLDKQFKMTDRPVIMP